MTPVEIILLSFGLAMDALAVAIASGFLVRTARVRHALKMGAAFGLFQMLMPLAGWLAGSGFRSVITAFDHWIAFGLLVAIGLKMILESAHSPEEEMRSNPFDFWPLIGLSVATSIDALAAGISFAFLKMDITLPVLSIGFVTFCLSTAGVFAGKKFGHFLENKVRILGGLVLIAIGAKILWEHLR
ncbi:MAG: manganese efflux pump MntP family protein [Candidatus Omnitrophota bacterium]|jgi:putative Mn2+ efflux pump MntP